MFATASGPGVGGTSVSVDSDVAVQLSKEEAVFFGDGDSTVDLNVFGACLDVLTERHGVEAFCNVDHVHLPDSFGFLEIAVDSGVPDSLMVNASAESFKRNVGLTAEAVDRVSDGVLVEAELGRIMDVEGTTETPGDEASYTDPEDIVEFVDRTGCDLFTVSIGT